MSDRIDMVDPEYVEKLEQRIAELEAAQERIEKRLSQDQQYIAQLEDELEARQAHDAAVLRVAQLEAEVMNKGSKLSKDETKSALRKRIDELEAEVGHHKQWLKERTSELEAIIRNKDNQIAQLEAYLRKYLRARMDKLDPNL